MQISIKTLGESIRTQRKQLGINQEQLADLSNTSLNFVSQMERGKETVRLSSLLSVLNVLGLEFHLRKGKSFISISNDIDRYPLF